MPRRGPARKATNGSDVGGLAEPLQRRQLGHVIDDLLGLAPARIPPAELGSVHPPRLRRLFRSGKSRCSLGLASALSMPIVKLPVQSLDLQTEIAARMNDESFGASYPDPAPMNSPPR
jgi:hypothetical protein